MDKQEAVKFIVQALELGRPQEEIVAALSGKLGAPPELVSKFVSQVAASQRPAPAPPPSPAPAPAPAPIPGASPPEGGAVPPRPASYMPPSPNMEQLQDEFEDMVVKELGRNRKQSDVVMLVCEQTGLNWDQAQRLVARIATKNRKKLTSKQNRIFIPLAAIAILVGLALIAAGISEVMDAAAHASDVVRDVDEVEFIVREVFWGFVTGAALLLGGIAGLIRALQTQFD